MKIIFKFIIFVTLSLTALNMSQAQSHATLANPMFYADASHDEPPTHHHHKLLYRQHSIAKGLPFFLYHEKVTQLEDRVQKNMDKKAQHQHRKAKLAA